ncbi:MAG TPA: hypothetical protein VIM11_28560 [Tepidisphaeraceae bacterium]|jgi:hypothetical protein
MSGELNDNSMRQSAVPRRFWWLTRFAIGLVALIAGLLILNQWWIHTADKRYQAVIDAAHARGEPILPADFDASPVPDEQNKALFLQNAAKAITLDPAYVAFQRSFDSDEPLTAEQLALIKKTLVANATALDLARRARSATGVDWKAPLRTPVISSPTAFIHLNQQRELAKLLRCSALYNHSIGNDRESIEAVRDIFNLIDGIARGPTALVVNLVGIGLTAMATDTIEKIAPALTIGQSNEPREGSALTGSASRAQVGELIAWLIDEGYWQRAMLRGWQGERMMELDAFSMIAGASKSGTAGLLRGSRGDPAALFSAALELDILRAVKFPVAGAAATMQSNWPAAQSMIPREKPGDSQIEESLTMLSRIITPTTGRGIEQQFRATVERRAAAIRLAIRMYRVDHGGSYPDTLARLAPAYLPGVPVDPFAADGRPMTYRPQAKPPVVYSVGTNGMDDGGTILQHNDPKGNWVPRWDCPDMVYPLETVPPPATQPSPEAENHE